MSKTNFVWSFNEDRCIETSYTKGGHRFHFPYFKVLNYSSRFFFFNYSIVLLDHTHVLYFYNLGCLDQCSVDKRTSTNLIGTRNTLLATCITIGTRFFLFVSSTERTWTSDHWEVHPRPDHLNYPSEFHTCVLLIDTIKP